MRRPILGLLLALVLPALGAPVVAHAHPTAAVAALDAAPKVDAVATSLRAAPPASPPVALLFGLAVAVLVAATGRRPRRALGLALVAMLVVFAAETGVHSVHHLGDRGAIACAVAATAGHLMVVLDAGIPAVEPPAALSAAVSAPHSSPPSAPSHGPDPARAPPAPIA